MEPIDILRERIAKHACGKYNLPAIVLNYGKKVTVFCCCREFAGELRSEISKSPDKGIENLNITFIAGNVEFV